MQGKTQQNILYSDLARWWHLLSIPEDYAEEAAIFLEAILSHSTSPPQTVLELGSGGGNNASHLKQHFQMTLVDLSPQMLAASSQVNPECRHIQGDMRDVRLGEQFDAVFIHDAIDYMATREDLRAAMETAFVHCRPGGVALFVPDSTRENFRPSTDHGGHDHGTRGIRYLEWTVDHDPTDDQYTTYMSYMVKDGATVWQSGLDEHICGLFAEQDWLDIMRDAGFAARTLPYDHSEFEKGTHRLFLGVKTQ